MREGTKDLLWRAHCVTLVFLNGGLVFVYHQTHLGKAAFAFLLAIILAWFAIRPRKRSKVGVEVPICRIEGGTRVADAEGRVFITTEDVDIGGR